MSYGPAGDGTLLMLHTAKTATDTMDRRLKVTRRDDNDKLVISCRVDATGPGAKSQEVGFIFRERAHVEQLRDELNLYLLDTL